MRRIIFVAIMWAVMATTAARAEEPVVVELFTSQGCSTCPPADALLGELAKRDDVIPLALHVDYWDYLGWEDVFADPAFTYRQKAYARAHGSRMVYTPQMIVDGRVALVGYKPMKLAEVISQVRDIDRPVSLDLRREGDDLIVSVEASEPMEGDFVVQLVRFDPEESIAIERGENAQKTLTYHNIVTSWEPIGTWNGRGSLALRKPVEGPEPVVVLVQQAGHGPIVAAARSR